MLEAVHAIRTLIRDLKTGQIQSHDVPLRRRVGKVRVDKYLAGQSIGHLDHITRSVHIGMIGSQELINRYPPFVVDVTALKEVDIGSHTRSGDHNIRV